MNRLSRKEIANLILNLSGKILITTHKNPDGDAVGSIIGWYNYLKNLGKNVKVITRDRIPYFYDFLPSVEKVENRESIDEYFDWTIITDVSEIKRTGFEKIPSNRIIVIDHHITAKPFADFSIVEPEISSSCELSLEIMKLINKDMITYSVALPIFTGMVTDTGSFGYNNTSPETFRNAAFLVERGVNPYTVTTNLFERNRVSRLKLLDLVLRTLKFELNGKVAYITMYRKFLKEAGAFPEESEGFINYPRSIEGVEVAIFFKEIEENHWKVSLRSKGKIDVASISTAFGGGGHKMAAGFDCVGNLEEIKRELIKAIELSLEKEKMETSLTKRKL
jgi:phosphoesterase RecJ-like protein